MNYVSISFYIIVLLCIISYYSLPIKCRWISLLMGSIFFYILAAKEVVLFFLTTGIISWILGNRIEKIRSDRGNIIKKVSVGGAIVIVTIPLFVVKYSAFFLGLLSGKTESDFIIPLGISFYTRKCLI